MAAQKVKKVCEQGHIFYKSSDCLSCPTCAELNKPDNGFLTMLGSPARSALLNEGIDSIQQLAKYSEKEVFALHGIGKSTLPILRKALADAGLAFKQEAKE